MENLPNLIFDRTKSDILRVIELANKYANKTITQEEKNEWNSGMKGSFNFEDLNRLELWTKALSDKLNSMGYATKHEPRLTPWVYAELPTQLDIDRIRRNINYLQDSFFAMPEWKEILFENKINYTQANAMEWDLQTCYNYIQQLSRIFIYSNQTNIACGLNWYFPYEFKKDSNSRWIGEIK